MRILLAIGDAVVTEDLRLLLTRTAHTADVLDWIGDGRQAERALAANRYDAVVLDRDLPRRSGIEVLVALRARRDDVPVLMLSSRERDQVADKVLALDSGADDYLAGPFDGDELRACLHAMLRRSAARSSPLLRHGNLVMDPAGHSVTVATARLKLSPLEFAILEALLRNAGKVLSREKLEELVYRWGEGVASNAVEVHIHHLRKKLPSNLIRTVRGVGYIVETQQTRARGIAAGRAGAPDGVALLPLDRFVFGIDRVDRLGEEVVDLVGRRRPVVLICDLGVVAAGLVERATQALAGSGLACEVFSGVPGEPSAATVDAAADRVRRTRAGCVVGLGGGSALDVAKLAAAIAPAAASVLLYALRAHSLPEQPVPKILVPTTAGTGSEATATATFRDVAGRKLWARGDSLRAELTLLDPTMTVGLPPALTAETGADALVHAIEAFTGRRTNRIAGGYALDAIRLITGNLQKVVEGGDDLAARGAMQVAASLAGIANESGGAGLARALGNALTWITGLRHGHADVLALRAVLAWNAAYAPAPHARVARALGVRADGRAETSGAAEVTSAYEGLLCSVGLPLTLDESRLATADVGRLIEAALAPENAPMRHNNARPVTRTDLERIAARLLAPCI